MLNLKPTKCNICNGDVIFTDNSTIYGKPYGSGKCYLCTNCGAYVGTHVFRPTEAFGLLANKEMRDLKIKCHNLFDKLWLKTGMHTRNSWYKKLANAMNIDVKDCHFGHFDIEQLNKAYSILIKGELK